MIRRLPPAAAGLLPVFSPAGQTKVPRRGDLFPKRGRSASPRPGLLQQRCLLVWLATVALLPLNLNGAEEPPVGGPGSESSSYESSAGSLELEFESEQHAGRTVSKEELLALDAVKLQSVYIPYIDADKDAFILSLKDFIAYAGAEPGDGVLANSYDGYFSVYQPEFIENFDPYLVLAFEGMEPSDMKLGDGPDLGPFYITFDERPEKGSDRLFDPDNKRPYGVNWLRVGDYREMMKPFYERPLISISRQIEHGRKLYINNCMSCHAYGEKKLGGTLSNRTSELLSVHARFNDAYFRQMVKDPSKWIPDVLMSPHPHYTDADIDAIAAFLERSHPQ